MPQTRQSYGQIDGPWLKPIFHTELIQAYRGLQYALLTEWTEQRVSQAYL